MAAASLRNIRPVEIPHSLQITAEGARTLGGFVNIPSEILLKIFNLLGQRDLENISRSNHTIRGVVVAGTEWGSKIQTFRMFNSALFNGRIRFFVGRSFRLDLEKQTCIFENSDGTEKNLLAEKALSLPFKISRFFALSESSMVCIGEDKQSCGKLDVDKENLTLAFTLLPSFLLSLPGISDILSPLQELYSFDIIRRGKDLHLLLRVRQNWGEKKHHEHFLIYEMDESRPSSCYIGNLKDYCRTDQFGALISRIQKIVFEDGEVRVAKQVDQPRERPRKKLWEVIGFTGNLLLIHTFEMLGNPGASDDNAKYHFLNKHTLIEEDSFVKRDISTNPAHLEILYIKGNISIYDNYPNVIITIDKKPLRLTPEVQSKLRAFAKINDFSADYKEDGSLEIKMSGETAKGEHIFIQTSAHPFVLMNSLSSAPPARFPQPNSGVVPSPFNPYIPAPALPPAPPAAPIPPLPPAPTLLQRISPYLKWIGLTLVAAALIRYSERILQFFKTTIQRWKKSV